MINLGHVKHMEAHDTKRLTFVLTGDDDEIVMSRQQSVLFRKSRNLLANGGTEK